MSIATDPSEQVRQHVWSLVAAEHTKASSETNEQLQKIDTLLNMAVPTAANSADQETLNTIWKVFNLCIRDRQANASSQLALFSRAIEDIGLMPDLEAIGTLFSTLQTGITQHKLKAQEHAIVHFYLAKKIALLAPHVPIETLMLENIIRA